LKSINRVGRIPEWIGGLSDLTLLDLDNNGLEGTIPDAFGQLTSLEYLQLGRNRLTGTVPESMELLSNLGMYFMGLCGVECLFYSFCSVRLHELPFSFAIF
jgi:hypothetical protein